MRVINLFFLLPIFVSCQKADRALKEARANIIGSWEVHATVYEIRFDDTHTTSTMVFAVSFDEDGTGSQEDDAGVVTEFEWLYQYKPEQVTIAIRQDSLPYLAYDVVQHEVLSNTRDRQVWTHRREVNGFVDAYEYLWVMYRK